MKNESLTCVESISRYLINHGVSEKLLISILSPIYYEEEVIESINHLIEEKKIKRVLHSYNDDGSAVYCLALNF